ncbi:glycerol-3-phosphate acyltransferase (plasmid) [Pontibacillus sp. ALD_SL1]|uniref:glycerol-3-phosphate acyltransferase n=1 Tax=Pontibacillus sp. ALD_SL1 TaxID=2777185 RepID=UPI001A96F688|nr:glycerol-3-phosphate acyltransferase [Pontibacillus sp. ALD_SL1]QST02121.1 glycerol-3-phosphate acyltransferase [Pontibacillus sp. ALD_SL1]
MLPLYLLLSYLIGCLNGSRVASYFKKTDVASQGVKNPGASNTTIVLGWKWGAFVALVDIAKAFIPVYLFSTLFDPPSPLPLYTIGALVVLGHNFPATHRFKGGKGTASVIGMIIAIEPLMGLLSLGLLIGVTLLSDYIVIGVLAMYATFGSMTFLFMDDASALLFFALALLNLLLHRENFRRIRNGTETTFFGVWKK